MKPIHIPDPMILADHRTDGSSERPDRTAAKEEDKGALSEQGRFPKQIARAQVQAVSKIVQVHGSGVWGSRR
jgi:hypothetical protein